MANKATGLILSTWLKHKLLKAEEKGADSEALLKTTLRLRNTIIFFRVLLSVFTLGIANLVFYGSIARKKYTSAEEKGDEWFDNKPVNFFSLNTHFHFVTKDAITSFNAQINSEEQNSSTDDDNSSDDQSSGQDNENDSSLDNSSSLSEQESLEAIQKNHKTLVYDLDKKAIFYNKGEELHIQFGKPDHHQRAMQIYGNIDVDKITPIHFEFSKTNFQFNWIEISDDVFDKAKNNTLGFKNYNLWSTDENLPLKAKDIKKHLSDLFNFPVELRLKKFRDGRTPRYQNLFSNLKHKDNIASITAYTYCPIDSCLLVVNENNILHRIPLIKDDENVLTRNGDAQTKQLEGDVPVTNISVSSDNAYIHITRQDGTSEDYTNDNDLNKVTVEKADDASSKSSEDPKATFAALRKHHSASNYKEHDHYEHTRKLIPLDKNGTKVFFERDGDSIRVLDADKQIVAKIDLPDEGSNFLIPVDYNVKDNITTASVIEFNDDDISFHAIKIDGNETTLNTNILYNCKSNITVATYNHSNSNLYFLQGDDLFMLTHENLLSHLPLSTFKIEGTDVLDINFVDNDKDLLITTNKQTVRIDMFEERYNSYFYSIETPQLSSPQSDL